MAESDNYHFSKVSSEQAAEYARQGADKRRSPQLKKARAEAGTILRRYKNGERVPDIAKSYGVPERTMWRIIRGQ